MFGRLVSLWQHAIRQSVRPPDPQVRHARARPLTRGEELKVVKKYVHRRLILWLGRQTDLIRPQAPANQRVLLCYLGVDNIGDALMDLSGRRLLRGRGWSIDLLIDPPLATLFEGDDVFATVHSDPAAIDPRAYGFVLLHNLNLRSIARKRKWLSRLPFSSIVGYVHGFDYNHIESSYAAFNRVFGLGLSDETVATSARPYLFELETRFVRALEAQRTREEPTQVIAVAVGGREAYRVYASWPEVFRALDRQGEIWSRYLFLLIGSTNGDDAARAVIEQPYRHLRVQSRVGRTDLFQCRALIAQADMFVGADGGLLHLAHTTPCPTVSLFSAAVPSELRLTRGCTSTPLDSTGDVSAIAPEDVAEAIRLRIQSQGSHDFT